MNFHFWFRTVTFSLLFLSFCFAQSTARSTEEKHNDVALLDDFDLIKAAADFHSKYNYSNKFYNNKSNVKHTTEWFAKKKLGKTTMDFSQGIVTSHEEYENVTKAVCIHDYLLNRRHQHLRYRLAQHRNVGPEKVSEAELQQLMYPRVAQRYKNVPFERINHEKQNRNTETEAQQVGQIRIHFYVDRVMDDPTGETCYTSDSTGCSNEDVVTNNKFSLLNESLAQAKELLNPLRLYQVSGNLDIGNQQRCGDLDLPSSWRENGVPNTDIALVVMMRKTSESVAGYAVECASDQYGRPILGHLNISPRTVRQNQIDYAAAVIAHEAIHALGFSGGKFSQFVDENQEPLGNSVISDTRTLNGDEMGIRFLATPTVKQVVNEYFDCENEILGGELEEYGGSGTSGSHWEQRIFYNELMTGSIQVVFGEVSSLSPLTFAALADSGWYFVDIQDVQNKLTWGKARGCTFATDSCTKWGTWADDKIDGYFCTENNEPHCSHNRHGKGYCFTRRESGLRDYYYHIEGTEKVGFMPLMDYCPHVVGFSNGDCRDTENSESSRERAHGENWGENSRCFRSTILAAGFTQSVEDKIKCYAYACGEGTLYIKVKDRWAKCDKNGGSPGNLLGFSGSLDCPPASEMCGSSETTDNFDQVERDGIYSGTLNDLKNVVWEKLSAVPLLGWVAIVAVIMFLICLCSCLCVIRYRNKKKSRKWKPERTYDLRNTEMQKY